MPDSKLIRGAVDRQRINLHEPYEVKYWTGKLQVSYDELRLAVSAVGDRASDVEAYLDSEQVPYAGLSSAEHSPKRPSPVLRHGAR